MPGDTDRIAAIIGLAAIDAQARTGKRKDVQRQGVTLRRGQREDTLLPGWRPNRKDREFLSLPGTIIGPQHAGHVVGGIGRSKNVRGGKGTHQDQEDSHRAKEGGRFHAGAFGATGVPILPRKLAQKRKKLGCLTARDCAIRRTYWATPCPLSNLTAPGATQTALLALQDFQLAGEVLKD